LLVTVGKNGVVQVWSVKAVLGDGHSPILELWGSAGGAQSVAVHPNGQQVASGHGPAVHVWEIGPGRREVTFLATGNQNPVTGVAFSPDGQQVAAPSGENTIRFWDVTTGRPLSTYQGQMGMVKTVAISSDGKLLAAGGMTAAQVWEIGSGRLLHSFPTPPGTNLSLVTFSPDDRQLAQAGSEPEVIVRSLPAGDVVLTRRAVTAPVSQLTFSPDGKRLAAGDRTTVRVWDMPSGRELYTLPPHEESQPGVAFSPDGRVLVTAAEDRSIRHWDGVTGAPLKRWPGLNQSVTTLCFSPDGRRLAGGDNASRLQVWDAATGTVMLTLEGYAGAGPLVWSPDGRRLATGDLGRAVMVWEAPGYQPHQGKGTPSEQQ
jgi:WD40 repeat protein